MPEKPRSALSNHLDDVWGHIEVHHLILATPGFIIYLDKDLDIEWKSTPEWDLSHPADEKRHRGILLRIAELEASDWDYSDPVRTRNFRRQLAEALACSFDDDYDSADTAISRAGTFREEVLALRKSAISEQEKANDEWRGLSRHWMRLHYVIGVLALLLSTFAAAKPPIFASMELPFGIASWLVAFLTGVLTFLNPEKKASRYRRAWVMLSNQVTRYRSDSSYRLEHVLTAYVEGQNLIAEATDHSATPTPATARRRRAQSEASI
jgi:hypothetical protein